MSTILLKPRLMTKWEHCCHCGLFHSGKGQMEHTARQNAINAIRECGRDRLMQGLMDECPDLPNEDALEAANADR